MSWMYLLFWVEKRSWGGMQSKSIDSRNHGWTCSQRRRSRKYTLLHWVAVRSLFFLCACTKAMLFGTQVAQHSHITLASRARKVTNWLILFLWDLQTILEGWLSAWVGALIELYGACSAVDFFWISSLLFYKAPFGVTAESVDFVR